MEPEILKKKTSLFSLFLTFAVDNLSATIVYPIFAPLFLDPSQNLLSSDLSLSFKTTILGIFLGVFPFMQFLFAPLLGEYADHHGRKRALILTTFLTFLGYGVCGWSIYHRVLPLIFLGRIVMGVGAANLSVCLSSLSDLSPSSKKRVRYFSYGSAIAGFTFVLGPFVGGKLSDPTINPLFHPYFPMFVGAVLGLLNLLFILFAFEETLEKPSKTPFDFIKGFHNIQLAVKTKAVKHLYLIYFFYLFSWNIIFLFVPAFVVQNFHLSNSSIGDICALLGVCWIFGTGVVYRLLYKVIQTKWILFTSFVLFSAVILLVPLPHHLFSFVVLLGACTTVSGLIWPLCTGAISNAAPRLFQGKVMGISQSLLSFTMMLASVVGGLFLHAHSLVPFAIASLSALVAAGILVRIYPKK